MLTHRSLMCSIASALIMLFLPNAALAEQPSSAQAVPQAATPDPFSGLLPLSLNQARIVFYRESYFVSGLLDARVRIDGQTVAWVSNGIAVYADHTPGNITVGQSGTEAPSYAMTADLYSPHQRATAVAVLQSGGSLGLLIGLFCGGLLLQHVGWRATFLVAGLPAVLLSVVLITTVREPVRGHSEGAHAGAAPPLMTVAQLIVQQRALVLLIVGVALACTGAYGLVSFLPTFLVRTHGLAPVQVGSIVALLFGAVGGAGLLIAGKLSDRLATRNVKWNLWLPSLSLIVGGTLVPVLLFAPSLTLALAAGVPAIFLNSMFYAPTFALTQSLVPIAMRATTTAILLFILNIVGAGLGPLLVGWTSDVVRVATGADGLRWALAVVSTGHILGGICFAIAAHFVSTDLARARALGSGAAAIGNN